MFSYFLTDEKNVGNLQRLKTVYIYSFIFFQIHKNILKNFKIFFFFFLLSLDLILFPFGFSQKNKQKTFQMEKSLAAPFKSEEREFWGWEYFSFPLKKIVSWISEQISGVILFFPKQFRKNIYHLFCTNQLFSRSVSRGIKE